MKAYKDKAFQRKRSSAARTRQQGKNSAGKTIEDNRPEAVTQRKLQALAESKTANIQPVQMVSKNNHSSKMPEVVQRKEVDGVMQFGGGGGKQLLEEAMQEYEEDQEYDDYDYDDYYEEEEVPERYRPPGDLMLSDFFPQQPQPEQQDQQPEQQDQQPQQQQGYPITVNQTRLNLTASQISNGTLEPVPNRTNGDIQLRINTSRGQVVLHVHPSAGSGGRPTGGGSSLGGSVGPVPGNVPQSIVDMIANRNDYEQVVANAAPRSRAQEDNNWRNR